MPLNVILGNPKNASPSISPDGRTLAFLAPDRKDVLNVFVRELAAEEAVDRQVTRDTHR